MSISPREARKLFFTFIFQLSGWALVALSCFPLQVPDVRVATRVPGSMLVMSGPQATAQWTKILSTLQQVQLHGQTD